MTKNKSINAKDFMGKTITKSFVYVDKKQDCLQKKLPTEETTKSFHFNKKETDCGKIT